MVAEKTPNVCILSELIYYPELEMVEYFIPAGPSIPETLGPNLTLT